MVDNITNFFGTDFAAKLKAANKRQRRFQFTDDTKKELLVNLKANMEKGFNATGELRYKWQVGSNDYDVAILKTPEDAIPYKTGQGRGDSTWHKTTMKHGDNYKKFISVFLNEEQFKQLVEDQEYVMVGYWKVGEWNGKANHSFNLHELIPLAECNNELERLRGSVL
jgi:hypothetical protein